MATDPSVWANILLKGTEWAKNPYGWMSDLGNAWYGDAKAKAKAAEQERIGNQKFLLENPTLFSGYAKYAQPGLDVMGKGSPDNTPDGDGGGGYVDPTAGYRSQSAKDRAQLQALYNAYAAQIAGNASGINTQYDANKAAVGNIYEQAAANVNAGYNAARDAQTQQWERLGLANLLGAAPQDSFSGQLAQTNRYNDLGANAQTFSEAQRQADLGRNRGLGNAIRGEQTNTLSNYDRMVSENVQAIQNQAAQNAASAASAQARAQAAAARLAYDRAQAADEREYQRQQDAANYALRRDESLRRWPVAQ